MCSSAIWPLYCCGVWRVSFDQQHHCLPHQIHRLTNVSIVYSLSPAYPYPLLPSPARRHLYHLVLSTPLVRRGAPSSILLPISDLPLPLSVVFHCAQVSFAARLSALSPPHCSLFLSLLSPHQLSLPIHCAIEGEHRNRPLRGRVEAPAMIKRIHM